MGTKQQLLPGSHGISACWWGRKKAMGYLTALRIGEIQHRQQVLTGKHMNQSESGSWTWKDSAQASSGGVQGVQRQAGGLEQSSHHGLPKLTTRDPLPGQGPTLERNCWEQNKNWAGNGQQRWKKRSLVKSWGWGKSWETSENKLEKL